MLRLVAAGACLVAAASLAASGAPKSSDASRSLVRSALRWAPRLDTQAARTLGASSLGGSARGRFSVYVLPTRTASLVDNDGDGQPTTGDVVIASGETFDLNGRFAGTWDGTFSHTSDASSMIQLTLRFPSRGTVTVTGAPYPDGSPFFDRNRRRFPAAPIAGYTGSARFVGSAGFGADQDDNLTLLLPR